MGAAVFAYGSTPELKGNNVVAPAYDPDGNSGNCFGFFAIWTCGGYYYQDVTLPAGKYTLTFPIYCASGTQANTSYTGFFPTSGTNQTVAINTTVGEWVNQTVTFTLTEETDGQIRIGYRSTGSGSGANPMLFYDGVKIEFTATVVKDALEATITKATNLNAAMSDENLTSAISNAQAVYDNASATQEQVNAGVATLNDALSAAIEATITATGDATFVTVNPGFEGCTAIGDNVASGDTANSMNIEGGWELINSAAWSSSAVVEYGGSGQVNGVSAPSADNAGDGGQTLGVSVGWGGTVTYRTPAVTLPAGVYCLTVNAYNANGDAQQFASKVGFVPTMGDATLSSKTSFASNTWETDVVTFTLDEATEGCIQVGGTAISNGSGANAKVFFDNITIAYYADATKPELAEAIANAPSVINSNVGDAAFQYPTAGVAAYSNALATAQTVFDDAGSTSTDYEDARIALEAAIDAYNALEVNAPADGQLFTVSLASGIWAANEVNFENEAMTYIANGRSDAGLYAIQYKEEANRNLAQAFTFTKVDGNGYKMSQIDADGEVRYICTGVPYGGNTSQIRTTTEANDALVVTVIPTTTEGVWNLKNTEADNYIGSQDAGVFTVNSHIDFKIVETAKPSITVNTTAAGWGTVMLPFAQALPSGVKAYTCAEVDDKELTLVEVDALEANKPYIIEGAWNATLTGDAQGTALTYTEGLLTGVYADTDAPVGSFVLQNPSAVAFYIVAEGKQPSVKANHAYLTAPAGTDEVKAFFLGDVETAIRSLQTEVENGAIYNLAGQRVVKAQKGVFVQNGRKVVVK